MRQRGSHLAHRHHARGEQQPLAVFELALQQALALGGVGQAQRHAALSGVGQRGVEAARSHLQRGAGLAWALGQQCTQALHTLAQGLQRHAGPQRREQPLRRHRAPGEPALLQVDQQHQLVQRLQRLQRRRCLRVHTSTSGTAAPRRWARSCAKARRTRWRRGCSRCFSHTSRSSRKWRAGTPSAGATPWSAKPRLSTQ